MRNFLLSLSLLYSFTTLVAQSEDCVDAQILAPIPTLLTDIQPIVVDELTNSGIEPTELLPLEVDVCGPTGYFPDPQGSDKSYWIAFSAVTTGTLEFMITPENNGTDYDFALWQGFCPNDPCSEPIFCSYLPSLCAVPYSPTGVSDDPQGVFGVDPTTSFEVYDQAIQIEAGQNYFLLVENRNEFLQCGIEDNLGFAIDFAGTATVGPLVDRPTIDPVTPPDTSQVLTVCQGDIETFEVNEVPFATNYDWITNTTLTDATITPNAAGNAVTVEFGTVSGQVCMEITCPIQSIICWDVQVDLQPDLTAIPAVAPSCTPIDLATQVQENNIGAIGDLTFFENEIDAQNDVNALASSIVNTSGDYWVKKTSPNGCTNIVAVTIQTDFVEIEPFSEPLIICTSTFFDLNNLAINLLQGDISTTNFSFYEDSLVAANQTAAPITPPTVFLDNQYWIRAESQNGSGCFDVTPINILFETQPDIVAIPLQSFCDNQCLLPQDLALTDANGLDITNFTRSFYTDEAAANLGNPADALAQICQTGSYWIRLSASENCFSTAPFDANVLTTPDIDNVALEIDCQFGCINLADQVFTELNGLDQADLEYTYFATEAEANDLNATPLPDLVICDPRSVWLRLTYIPSGCFDVASVDITGMQVASAILNGAATICVGEMATFALNITGTPPFNIIYTDGVSQFEINAPANTFLETVSPTTTTTYSLVSIIDGNGCQGATEGQATINVNNSPQVSNLSQNCTSTATHFTISFDIEGGNPAAYQVTGLAGTLMGNTFLSDSIPTGSSYSFEVSDDSGCSPIINSATFSCECNSVVGEMDRMPIQVCEREPAIAFYLEGDILEKGDTLLFVLHDSPSDQLGNVISESDTPIFTFDETTMVLGQIYYISAVITKADVQGNPILNAGNNPCLTSSIGAPVTFFPIPAIQLTLSSDTICQGESSNLVFNITGVGPYDVNYFDGEKIVSLMSISDGHTIAVSPSFSASFNVSSIAQAGVPTCVNNNMVFETIDLTVLIPPTEDNFDISCNEEGNMLVLSFDIIDGDGNYTVDGLSGQIMGNTFISDSIPHNTPYTITIEDNTICSNPPLSGIAECFCTADLMVAIEITQPVSCRGEKDGALRAELLNGAAPFIYFWSNGANTENVSDISPGLTSVTITDANGCVLEDSINLEEPESVTATFNTIPISCEGRSDGGILIVGVEGGTGDYTYSFNGSAFQANNLRENLGIGAYDIAVQDENGCLWTGEAILESPPPFLVSLGGDQTVNLGDSIQLEAQVNQTDILLQWESEGIIICDNCTGLQISPLRSERYKVTAINSTGCEVSDEIQVLVQNNRRIFFPNAFSPNGDGNNDRLRPFISTEVSQINIFRIYNRWGELMYEKENMLSELDFEGWDGEFNGREAPNGVYVYYLEIDFINGSNDILVGDVTLWR